MADTFDIAYPVPYSVLIVTQELFDYDKHWIEKNKIQLK